MTRRTDKTMIAGVLAGVVVLLGLSFVLIPFVFTEVAPGAIFLAIIFAIVAWYEVAEQVTSIKTRLIWVTVGALATLFCHFAVGSWWPVLFALAGIFTFTVFISTVAAWFVRPRPYEPYDAH